MGVSQSGAYARGAVPLRVELFQGHIEKRAVAVLYKPDDQGHQDACHRQADNDPIKEHVAFVVAFNQ